MDYKLIAAIAAQSLSLRPIFKELIGVVLVWSAHLQMSLLFGNTLTTPEEMLLSTFLWYGAIAVSSLAFISASAKSMLPPTVAAIVMIVFFAIGHKGVYLIAAGLAIAGFGLYAIAGAYGQDQTNAPASK